MSSARTILHLDMDAFFASIEQRDHPHLRNKPVLVGHDGPRGVVAAASYEARPFGCRSAMPIAVAKRLCPHALIVPVNHTLYRSVSRQIFSILEDFTPAIEPLSIDEAFLDLTGTAQLHGPPKSAARRMKDRIKNELALTASVGIAPNKFLAKLASDLQKPDGLFEIRTEDIDTLLPPMPVTKLWGVGPATEARLKLLGIATIRDLRSFPPDILHQQLGDNEADHYLRLAHGLDDRPVSSDHQAKSIGTEQTFETNIASPDEIRRILFDQVDQVAHRLRKHHLLAKTLTLKIRFGNFQTVTRSKSLPAATPPTDSTAQLESLALALWHDWSSTTFHPVRLIGATASNLSTGQSQLPLFEDPANARQSRIDSATDALRNRFGPTAIRRGGALE